MQELLSAAARIAARLGNEEVLLEHLLLATLEPPEPRYQAALRAARVDIVELRAVLEAQLSGFAVPDAPASPRLGDELATFAGQALVNRGEVTVSALRVPRILSSLRDEAIDVELLVELLSAEPDTEPSPTTTFIETYCVDVTERARRGAIDPVVGREPELRQLIQILTRRLKNNPLLLGEPGVGKSALIEGLARRIVAKQVPAHLVGCRLLALDLGAMLAGTRYRGEFEARLKGLLTEVTELGRALLFIDEIHMLVGAGSAAGGADAANLIKPALARGELRCIGATTPREYRQSVERDAALSRRFQVLNVEEPSPEQALTMLRGLRQTFEAHHGLTITDDAVRAAVSLSHRYLTERYLPDKAIDLMDQACASVRSVFASSPEALELLHDRRLALEVEARVEGLSSEEKARIQAELASTKGELKARTAEWLRRRSSSRRAQELRVRLQEVQSEMERVSSERRYAELAKLQHQVLPELERELASLSDGQPAYPHVRAEDVARVTSQLTGIPTSKLDESETQRLQRLEQTLGARVVGQPRAVERVARAIRRARAQLRDPRKPIASFLLVGPTGVGKTELCKAVAEFLSGEERALLRFDMSEYQEKHTVARLIGAPPGYVGYDAGGELTNQVRRRPFSVLLFDEVEKAHADVFNVLLQVLDEGHLMDAGGTRVDFKHTIVMLTSNLGGSTVPDLDVTVHEEQRRRAIARFFRPEFVNRLDDVLVFHPLKLEDAVQIVAKQLNVVCGLLEQQGIGLTWDPAALQMIAERAYDAENGARPVQRFVRDYVQDPIAQRLVDSELQTGQRVHVTASLDLEVVDSPFRSGH
jgi:ATP-dependent Clp protease ATP-binding subunit ClpB